MLAKVEFDGKANWFTLTFPFEDQDITAKAAEIPGAKYFKPKSCWVAPKYSAVAVISWAYETGIHVSTEALEAMEDVEKFESVIEKSRAKKPVYPGQTYGVAVELFDYQQAGLEYILTHGKGQLIIGDEMGVGKTLQAIAAVHSAGKYPAVVICPAGLKVNWRREIQKAAPGTSIEILRGETAHPRLFHADWTIINYDILPAWEKCLPEFPGAVIADESHYISNPAIDRTKAALRVFDTAGYDGIRLCLSGTAVLNKTGEIMTQLQAVGRLEEVGGTGARRQWKGQGAELNRFMRGNGMYLRRLKADVWKDAPGRHWAPFMVEGDPVAMKEYRRAEKNIVKWLSDKAKAAARDAGATTKEAEDAAWQAVFKAQAAEILVEFTHLKRLAAHAKMPAVKDWVDTFMAGDEKLAAFAWHSDTIAEIVSNHAKFKPLIIEGGQTERQRQSSVDLFQGNKSHRLLVGQIKAAGVGITLTAASNVLLAELGWTPGAHDQLLDRCHRRGQTNDVVGWIPICTGTIEEDIYALVEAKRPIVDNTLDGYARTAVDTDSSIVEELAAKFHRM